LAAEISGAKADILRTLGDSIKDKAPDAVAVIAGDGSIVCVCGKEAAAAGAHAGNIVRKVSALTGGKGGGRPDSAMAGIGDASKVKEAIAAVGGIVSEFVK
ncbi:MAG: alanine--tRNA ligase, partial [Oscillospiraceae bacterium]